MEWYAAMCQIMEFSEVSWNGLWESVMEENVRMCNGIGYLAVSGNGMLGYVIDWNTGKFHGL